MTPAAKGTEGQRFLEQVDRRRAEVAEATATILGTGDAAALATQARWRPSSLLVRLAALAALSALPLVLFTALLPDISDALGASRAALTSTSLLIQVVIAVSAFGVAAWVHRSGRNTRFVVSAAVLGAACTCGVALTATSGALLLLLIGAAIAAATARTVHPAWLVDGHTPAVHGRALTAHRAADVVGRVVGLSFAAVLASWGWTWRGAFLFAGIAGLVALVVIRRVPAPTPGGYDTAEVRAVLREDHDSDADDEPSRPLWEELRRATHLPTVRGVLGVWAALGAVVVPLAGFVGFFLAQRWHVTATGRLGVLAVATAFTLPVLGLAGPRIDAAFADDAGRPLQLASAAFVVAGVALAVAGAVPWFPVAVFAIGVAFAATSIVVPVLDLVSLSVVPSPARPLVAAVAQAVSLGIGGVGGFLVFGGVDRRFGLAGGVASLLVPAGIGALVARRTASAVAADLRRLGDDVIVTEELHRHAAAGQRLPLLVCRQLDFSYGALQVLFGVDFTVEEGQLVALLGTNGAGKSTLLRVISGLGLPSSGSVHLRGEDITFLDPERRLGLGVAQVPGGRAVFGPLTVVDNLRVISGDSRSRRDTEAAIDDVFNVFPRLGERRNQLAATLSGGEQQMLGLSKALLLQPQLLLVDELSLGLAPKVVAELLAMVRQINAAGTAVVLVEQSVNVALSIANHAYFMEKGEVRFDGPAADLLDRNDLVRSVFLGGAARRLASTGKPQQ